MEVFQLVLIVLICVIASAVADQLIMRVSLPLIQIVIGFAAALLIPATHDAQVPSDLFLVLFVAPLLFNESRHFNPADLMEYKWPILSLAVGLVLALMLAMGASLHFLIPVIPLAAALVCGAALAPTDAAAVAALGQNVHLTRRQNTVLSAESMINDASGVIAFQFAMIAVTTGSFSPAQAGGQFLLLFFGGIICGVVLGLALRGLFRFIRHHGYETTPIHIIYEVLTPFLIYLLSNSLGVSGITAVVAAGITMAEPSPRLTSAAIARLRMVSKSVWEVLDFLINGILFVMLGMQLPLALNPAITEDPTPTSLLIVYVLVLTVVMIAVRFIWTFLMELYSIRRRTGTVANADLRPAIRRALVMTAAGPKGAITLSLIFTIPHVVGGMVFPSRDLIIFLTAGVILCTLLVADIALPILAPVPEDQTALPEQLTTAEARDKVLGMVINELEANIAHHTTPELEPATRAVISQYQHRMAAGRRRAAPPEILDKLRLDVTQAQMELLQQDEIREEYGSVAIRRYERILSRRLKALGADVHSNVFSHLIVSARRLALRLRMFVRRLQHQRKGLDPDSTISMTPLQEMKAEELAARLERCAIEQLKQLRENVSRDTRRAASLMLEEHRISLASIKAKIASAQQAEAERIAEAEAKAAAKAAELAAEKAARERAAAAAAGATGSPDPDAGHADAADAADAAGEADGVDAASAADEARTTPAGVDSSNTSSPAEPAADEAAPAADSNAAGSASGAGSPAADAAANAAGSTLSSSDTSGQLPLAVPAGLAATVSGKPASSPKRITRSFRDLSGVRFITKLARKQEPTRPDQDAGRRRLQQGLAYASSMSRVLGLDMSSITPEQMELLSAHLAEVESAALILELDKINELHNEGKIEVKTARELREDVYLLQMGLSS